MSRVEIVTAWCPGATKARYVAAVVGGALVFLQKGSEAKLHAGDTIDVEPRRAQSH